MARRRKAKQRSRLRRAATWLGLVALAVVLLSFAAVLPLRWTNPVSTAFMKQDTSGRDPLLYEWVAWQDLGTAAPLAVVAAEDQRFADHFGLDVTAIRKAVGEKDQRGYLRGASTITQQTAKNLYLWPGRNVLRKGLEAWLAVIIETSLPKRRILEIYLNVAEFGPGISRVGAASRYYFGRAPARLRDSEAALLAAVLPNPKRLRVDAPSEYVRERQRWILTQMQRFEREAWLQRIER